jgi:hypothetical protein
MAVVYTDNTVLIIVILAGILISVFEAFSSKGQAVPNLTRLEYRPYQHFIISSLVAHSTAAISTLVFVLIVLTTADDLWPVFFGAFVLLVVECFTRLQRGRWSGPKD